MSSLTARLKDLYEISRKIKHYRDLRLDEKFIKQEKESTLQLIAEEEVSSIIKEDELYENTSIQELTDISDAILDCKDFSNDDIEEINFKSLFDIKTEDLIILRIYKEIEKRVTIKEVKDIIDERFNNLLIEYLKEELSETEIEYLKEQNQSIKKITENETNQELNYLIIHEKIKTDVLDVYCHLLNIYTSDLDKNTNEYKTIRKFIENMIFLNKCLDNVSELLYNTHKKIIKISSDYYSDIYNIDQENVDLIRKTFLLNCYDYGTECLFKEDYSKMPDNKKDIFKIVVKTYLSAIQVMLNKEDLQELYQVVEDCYFLQIGNSKDDYVCNTIKDEIISNIEFIEKRKTRDSIYVKRR